MISNFRRVLYVVCFLLGNSPVSEFYMPTFRNTLSVPSSYESRCKITIFEPTFSRMDTPTILKFSHFTPTCLWRWNRQSVPKRRHIKFRRRGITQKKSYNIILDHSLIFTVIIPEVLLIQLSSWGWAQGCSKHVEDSNKYIIEETVRQVGQLPELTSTYPDYVRRNHRWPVIICFKPT